MTIALADPLTEPVLRRLRAELDALYGDRIERVVLYGSRARGDARPDSDYDVAVFLTDLSDRRAEWRRLSTVSSALLEETGQDIQAWPFAAGAWRERNPLMHDIREQGIDVGPPRPIPLDSFPVYHAEPGAMSPEAAFFIEKARKLLAEAEGVLSLNYFEQAGRIGYAAAFNAAQALIFERDHRVVKTHTGVKARFNLLTKDNPAITAPLAQFLETGFKLKKVADYPEPSDPEVSPEEGKRAVETARRFIASVAAVLGGSAPA